MIGTKKLSVIRDDIRQALASATADPIQRLERQLTSARRKGERSEVVESLKRFLESPQKRPRRQSDAGAKTSGPAK